MGSIECGCAPAVGEGQREAAPLWAGGRNIHRSRSQRRKEQLVLASWHGPNRRAQSGYVC
eukprot:6457744-Amphidinium_carterae.2